MYLSVRLPADQRGAGRLVGATLQLRVGRTLPGRHQLQLCGGHVQLVAAGSGLSAHGKPHIFPTTKKKTAIVPFFFMGVTLGCRLYQAQQVLVRARHKWNRFALTHCMK